MNHPSSSQVTSHGERSSQGYQTPASDTATRASTPPPRPVTLPIDAASDGSDEVQPLLQNSEASRNNGARKYPDATRETTTSKVTRAVKQTTDKIKNKVTKSSFTRLEDAKDKSTDAPQSSHQSSNEERRNSANVTTGQVVNYFYSCQ